MIVSRIKTDWFDYHVDVRHRKQGEYKEYWSIVPNNLQVHCFYKDNEPHGECKEFNSHGELIKHSLYIHGKKYHIPIDKILNEDRMMLTIKYGVQWL